MCERGSHAVALRNGMRCARRSANLTKDAIGRGRSAISPTKTSIANSRSQEPGKSHDLQSKDWEFASLSLPVHRALHPVTDKEMDVKIVSN
jgi:hypothetical protein